ncbi:SGNH/GDSL hydrolase family protein [Rarobacter incanus]|uniref:SGNH/GDSL hydrolase family protein n=1 Tax=Rarobacter incanus TaxID=153494 RepID=UPI001FE67C11|nr:SGNH/GDSL hydrolase family protein [Rarobacter incanus]
MRTKHTIPFTDQFVRGAADLEITSEGAIPHRIATANRHRYRDPQLMGAEAQPSGVRVELLTAATTVELTVHTTRFTYAGITRPRGQIDIEVDGHIIASHALTGGTALETDFATGTTSRTVGPDDVVTISDLPTGTHHIAMWLPFNEQVELRSLVADAAALPVAAAGVTWINYGSSISQGSNAASPTGIWPVVAARNTGNVDLINMGFGGSAMADPFIARQIAQTRADVISASIGINVVNLDAMHERIFVPLVHGFLDTIRDGHPTTPILLITPIFCGIHEDTPGPGAFDPAAFATGTARFIATGDPADAAPRHLTLTSIRRLLTSISNERSDPHLHLIDGLELFGAADAEALPLPDALHPGPAAHDLIGTRFARFLCTVASAR